MADIEPFALIVLVVSIALIAAVYSNRLSQWVRVPAPALFLLAATCAATIFPSLGGLSHEVDVRIVTVALALILFDGGMHIGWRRFRLVAGAVTVLGVVGTLATAVGIALAAHFLFEFDWQLSLLLGAALSPTDPAVVFSVLGKREIEGRTGTILEGESGANDPVGIAVMVSLLGATGAGVDAIGSGLLEFGFQMAVGCGVGYVGGWLFFRLMRTTSLPSEALYSVRTLAAAGVIYGAATLLHGSGFLAVLLAGIIIGDVRAPFHLEVKRFTAGFASIAEVTVFVVLGLSINLKAVFSPNILWVGLGIAALLGLVIRPVVVGVLMLPVRLRWGERLFVIWAGLKGAVPIVLGLFVLAANVAGAQRLYDVVFVVVLASVVIQGGLVPVFATLFRVPMRVAQPAPWASGLRLTREPDGTARLTVESGSPADGRTVAELALGEDGWISLVERDGELVQVRGSTRFQAGDTVLALGNPPESFDTIFGAPKS